MCITCNNESKHREVKFIGFFPDEEVYICTACLAQALRQPSQVLVWGWRKVKE